MATASYPDLLKMAQPQIIDDERSHRRALRIVDALMAKPRLSAAEQKLVDLLAKLVNDYEESVQPTPAVSPVKMLAHLMDARGDSQASLARAIGIPRSTISEILKGKRAVSVPNAFRLGKYFHVDPAAFLEAG